MDPKDHDPLLESLEQWSLQLYFLVLVYFCNYLNLENKIFLILTKIEFSSVCLYALRGSLQFAGMNSG